MMVKEWQLLGQMANFEFRLEVNDLSSVMAALRIELEIIQKLMTL